MGGAERRLAMNMKDLSEVRALKILAAAQIMNLIGLFFFIVDSQRCDWNADLKLSELGF